MGSSCKTVLIRKAGIGCHRFTLCQRLLYFVPQVVGVTLTLGQPGLIGRLQLLLLSDRKAAPREAVRNLAINARQRLPILVADSRRQCF